MSREIFREDLDWDENKGYSLPFFTVSVEKGGRLILNCFDEYEVVLNDAGLATLKRAVDLAYSEQQ